MAAWSAMAVIMLEARHVRLQHRKPYASSNNPEAHFGMTAFQVWSAGQSPVVSDHQAAICLSWARVEDVSGAGKQQNALCVTR